MTKGLYVHPARRCTRSYGFVGNAVHQLRALLIAPRYEVHRRTLYISDPPIDLGAYIDAFSRALTGKNARRAPYSVMRAAAITGDLLRKVGWHEPLLTTYRLANMTTDNIIDVSDTLVIAGPGPYSLEEGVRETVEWMQRANS
jgi:nucleoside-diphosphate-sugar epimerase